MLFLIRMYKHARRFLSSCLRSNGRRVVKSAAIVCFFAWPLAASAASHFVLPVATGFATGADWNNAWSLQGINWSGLSSGDTIYLAGGIYTNALSVAADNITVKRVLSSDAVASGAAGWNPAYDSVVYITNIVNNANTFIGIRWSGTAGNNVTIDGRVDGGICLGCSEQTTPDQSWVAALMVLFNQSVSISGVVLTNLELIGPGSPLLANSTGIYVTASAMTSFRVTHCRIHAMVDGIQNASSVINSEVDHCFFYDDRPGNNGWSPGPYNPQHDNIWYASGCTNIVFADNICSNWGTECLLLSQNPNDRWYIYNNLFIGINSGSYDRTYEQQTDCSHIYFFNNTSVNQSYGACFHVSSGSFSGGTTNNIFFNTGVNQAPNSDYNLYNVATSEPHGQANATRGIFVNYVANNYHIVNTVGAGYPAEAGFNLGAPYNVDMDGVTRPATGATDVGAYEPTVQTVETPSPPTSLGVIGP